MIRFIDIGKQTWLDESDPECPRQFAWYDTVTDTFMSFGGDQVFDSWQEFEESFKEEFRNKTIGVGMFKQELIRLLARFKSLCPTWALEAGS